MEFIYFRDYLFPNLECNCSQTDRQKLIPNGIKCNVLHNRISVLRLLLSLMLQRRNLKTNCFFIKCRVEMYNSVTILFVHWNMLFWWCGLTMQYQCLTRNLKHTVQLHLGKTHDPDYQTLSAFYTSLKILNK